MKVCLSIAKVCLLALLAGCDPVEFPPPVEPRLQSLEDRVAKLAANQRQADATTDMLGQFANSSVSGLKSADAALASRCQATEALAKSLIDDLAAERAARTKAVTTLSEQMDRKLAAFDTMLDAISELLATEKELLISLLEAQQSIEELRKQGVITDKELKVSATVRIEKQVLVERIRRITEMLSQMQKARQAAGAKPN